MPPAKPSTLSLVGSFKLLCAPGCLRDEYSVSARNLGICQSFSCGCRGCEQALLMECAG